MSKMQSKSGRVMRSADGGSGRTLRAALSFGGIARDNHQIAVDGWIIPESKSVPLLDSHNDRGIRNVLGRVTDIHVGTAATASGQMQKALLGTLNFAEPEINPDAETAYRLYSSGYADGLSVSFIPKKWTYADDRSGMNISQAELLEVSTVAIPSDVDARVLGRALRTHASGHATLEDEQLLRSIKASRYRAEAQAYRRRQLFERCQILRSGYGFSIEMAALSMRMQPGQLRQIIAAHL